MREKAEAQAMVEEMTEFLADYGLSWVGTPGDE